MSIDTDGAQQIVTALDWLEALDAPLLAAIVSGTIALFSQRAEDQKFLLDTLGHFTGGTQNRSVGLGVIEGNLDFFSKKYAKTVVPVLVNQLAYLTIQKPAEEAHEAINRERILHALSQIKVRRADIFTQDQNDLISKCKNWVP